MLLHIAATERTPEIELHQEPLKLSIKGESFPEDVAAFYGQVIQAVINLSTSANGPLQVEMAMIYINSSSIKAFYRIFEGIEAYRKRVDAHLDSLHIAPNRRDAYLRQRDIYASILYTDDMLRRLFEALARSPDGANTLVVITGDHRMPDIPMDTRLERYHVPLIVASLWMMQAFMTGEWRFSMFFPRLSVAPA